MASSVLVAAFWMAFQPKDASVGHAFNEDSFTPSPFRFSIFTRLDDETKHQVASWLMSSVPDLKVLDGH